MEINESYRQFIKSICANFDTTPTGIARRIGVSPSTITRQLKAGWKREPQLSVLRKICDHFDIDAPRELFRSSSEGLRHLVIGDELNFQIKELKYRMTSSQENYASLSRRLDRVEELIERMALLHTKLNGELN